MSELTTRSNWDKEQGDVSQKVCDDDAMIHRHARKDICRRQYLGNGRVTGCAVRQDDRDDETDRLVANEYGRL